MVTNNLMIENLFTGPYAEELPTTEEFFLPGSGASRGLTSQDLEASRTATWDDNMATMDDVDRPGALQHSASFQSGGAVEKLRQAP